MIKKVLLRGQKKSERVRSPRKNMGTMFLKL
nr:MAG TPA: hypothetical protein [Caudoviricetes sp.]